MMASINRQRFTQLETKGRSLAIVFSKIADVDEAVRTLESFGALMRESARAMVAERETGMEHG